MGVEGLSSRATGVVVGIRSRGFAVESLLTSSDASDGVATH